MSTAETWSWDEAAFVLAWEAGVFGEARVELVRGEVWPVTIGAWHGVVAANVAHLLRHPGWTVSLATLPAGDSLPDPDAWLVRRGAVPLARLGGTGRLARWNPADVALVVEVADTSLVADTQVKAAVYGAAAYATYWVVHRGGVEVFSEPFEGGYRRREHVAVDGVVTVPGSGVTLAVAELLDDAD